MSLDRPRKGLIMSYTNVPPYMPAKGMRVLKAHRFAIATRVPGQGAVVTSAYKTKHEAERAKRRAEYHHEWCSPVLERVADGFVPAAARRRRMYALPTPVAAVS